MGLPKRYSVTMKRSYSCSMPGVWRAVAHSRGALVVFHSPKACAHIVASMAAGDHYRAAANLQQQAAYNTPMLASSLEEKDAVFGGAERLAECLKYAIEHYRPNYVVIANSCVSGVIGDDTEAVASRIEQENGIPVLAVSCCGFLADNYYEGYYQTALLMMQKMMRQEKKIPDSVLLIGDRGGADSADCREMQRLLNCFGLNLLKQFPSYTNYDEMNLPTRASLSVIMGGSKQAYDCMRSIADALRDKFCTPFYDVDYPVGVQNTLDWINGLGALLGEEEIAKQIAQAETGRLEDSIAVFSEKLVGQKVMCCLGRSTEKLNVGWVLELLALCGVRCERIVLLDALSKPDKQGLEEMLRDCGFQLLAETEVDDTLLASADLIITTHELQTWNKRQFVLPMMPPVGITGMLSAATKLFHLAKRNEKRGGVIYG